ncbi:MAG: hypothetical protein ABJC10_13200 [Acidobacteriota bacterium]
MTANRKTSRFLVLAMIGLLVTLPASAQSAKPFQGEWEWAVYAKSRDELPPAYRKERLRDVPGAAIYLKIKQRGNKLTGEYSGSDRFLARLEEGEFDAIAIGNRAELELTSGFGGTVTVRLTLQGNRILWKAIKSDGEFYFPRDVFLHRVVRRKSRH